MASSSANTLLFASETGKEDGDISLIFTVSPGHQVFAANKAKGLAACSPTLVLQGRWSQGLSTRHPPGQAGTAGISNVPGRETEAQTWWSNSVLFTVMSLWYILCIWFIHWEICMANCFKMQFKQNICKSRSIYFAYPLQRGFPVVLAELQIC